MREIEKQFNEYLSYCENVRRMSKETIRNKRWTYRLFLESTKISKISELTNMDVNKWVSGQTARGCAGRTINVRLAHIIAAVRYFQDIGIVIPNFNTRMVVKAKEMPPRRAFYTTKQIKQVLAHADRLEWLLISLSYDCGFRISELQRLRLRNIDGRRICFIGKGSKARESYISEQTKERLDEWIIAEDIKDYLWIRRRHKGKIKPITVEECRNLMKKPFRQAGFNDFYPHALRHSFATNICKNGAPLPIAQKMLGHSNLATTERYVHTFDGHLEEYFDQYKFATA